MNDKALAKIIVGSDFNELSAAALRFAAGIASRSGASLTVVYADIFDGPAEFTSSQVRHIAEKIARSKQLTQKQLEQHVAHHVPPGVKYEAIVVDGLPATAMADLADREHADLIVLGTHGRGGLQRLVIGSVAEAVMREARVPVLTVRKAAAGPIRRILCPVNDRHVSSVAVEEAARIARAVGASLTLIHFEIEGRPGSLDVDALIPAGVQCDVVRRRIAHDDPAAEILAEDDGGTFDLIVIGAEHKRIHDVTLFGKTTTAVTRHARTPVLIVAPPEGAEAAPLSQGAETHAV